MVMKEIRMIEWIRKNMPPAGKGVVEGIGDDCAVLEYTAKKYLLWAADMVVEGVHFRVKDAGFERIGRKAVAVNISDIAAMGGTPLYILVSVGLPPKYGEKALKGIYRGIKAICGEYGMKVIGGDIDRSEKLVVDVSIMGVVEKDRLVRRDGARPGEVVLITGPVRDGKKTHFDFEPRVKEAAFLARGYHVSSMIDVSDGIAPDLGRICSASGVGTRLYLSAVPLSAGLSIDDALHYGESFELLFTMPVKEARKLFIDLGKKKMTPEYFIIGETTAKSKGMKIVGDEGIVSELRIEGYKHL